MWYHILHAAISVPCMVRYTELDLPSYIILDVFAYLLLSTIRDTIYGIIYHGSINGSVYVPYVVPQMQPLWYHISCHIWYHIWHHICTAAYGTIYVTNTQIKYHTLYILNRLRKRHVPKSSWQFVMKKECKVVEWLLSVYELLLQSMD